MLQLLKERVRDWIAFAIATLPIGTLAFLSECPFGVCAGLIMLFVGANSALIGSLHYLRYRDHRDFVKRHGGDEIKAQRYLSEEVGVLER